VDASVENSENGRSALLPEQLDEFFDGQSGRPNLRFQQSGADRFALMDRNG
jgi:hypothetical protein